MLYEIVQPHPPEIPAFTRGPFNFYVSSPVNGCNAETIPVLALHGLGQEGSPKYIASMHQSFQEKSNLLLITVDYLGCKMLQRPYVEPTFDEWCLTQSNIHLKTLGLPLIPQTILNEKNVLAALIEHLGTYPESFVAAKTPLCCVLRRYPDDHYDFGLIQAIDCLWALAETKKLYANINWKALSVVGVSHGAYLATQCARFAPNTFALVVNIYGWTEVYDPWLLRGTQAAVQLGKYSAVIVPDNYWTNDAASPNYLSAARRLIRKQNNLNQLQQWRKQAQGQGPHFVFTHQIDDVKHPLTPKRELVAMMRELNFNLEYHERNVEGATQYRSLDQLGNVSFKGSIYDFVTPDRCSKFPVLTSDLERRSVITYDCGDKRYEINYAAGYPILNVQDII